MTDKSTTKGTESRTEKRKVLILDDSELTLGATAMALERGGYEVKTAASIGSAETILARWSPDVVLTDVNMPGVEGNQVCAWIKAHQMHAAPIVLYSGLPEEDLEPIARLSGADGFLTKAKGLRHLVTHLGAIFNGASS
jgi:DNA-binding response OmpR family regulator